MFTKFLGALGGGAASGDGRVTIVDPTQIREWMAAGQVVLIDVREKDENLAERIEGAINIPLSSFDPAKVPRPDDGQRLVLHCRSGVRCGSATNLLLAAGWEGDVVRMQGGILGWAASGGPTVRGK